MRQDEQIKQEIIQILRNLEKKESKAFGIGALAFLITAGVLTLIGFLLFEFTNLNFQGAWEIGTIVGILLISFVICATVFNSIVEPESEASALLYKEKFPDNTSEREKADRILAATEKPSTANSLRNKLGIKRLAEVKREKEENEARWRREEARKAFVITSSFKCSACGASINIERLGQSLRCKKCDKQLKMPLYVSCPSCASNSTKIVSPEEQVKGHSKGKLAGALMYGPAGLLAGAILDGVKDATVGNIQKSIKKHKLKCTDCNHIWAIKVPAVEKSTRE